jgi:hypothetical protein
MRPASSSPFSPIVLFYKNDIDPFLGLNFIKYRVNNKTFREFQKINYNTIECISIYAPALVDAETFK